MFLAGPKNTRRAAQMRSVYTRGEQPLLKRKKDLGRATERERECPHRHFGAPFSRYF